jgi:hypothetical protein
VLVVVRVHCPGFTGETDTWVVRPAWREFLERLTALEGSRRGEAILESISPGELRLRLFATDRAGHMAVEGYVGVFGGHDTLRLEFGAIPFEPTLLPRLLRELSSAVAAV